MSLPKLLPLNDIPVESKWSPKPPPSMWGVGIGAWGDVILDLAMFKSTIGRGGIILFVKDAAIVDFVKAQTFIDEVIWVKPTSEEDYLEQYFYACSTWAADDPYPIAEIVRRSGIDPARVAQTQLRPERRGLTPWHGARLPRSAWKWAYNIVRSLITTNFYVLHPYSLNSSPLDCHWPLWEGAIEYLLRYTKHTYILTGADWQTDIKHPRLINLVGASDTMMDVFALAEMSKGVITTSNSLSHYAVIQNLPAVVCCNAHLTPYESPFRQFLQEENIDILYYEDGLAKFVNLASHVIR